MSDKPIMGVVVPVGGVWTASESRAPTGTEATMADATTQPSRSTQALLREYAEQETSALFRLGYRKMLQAENAQLDPAVRMRARLKGRELAKVLARRFGIETSEREHNRGRKP